MALRDIVRREVPRSVAARRAAFRPFVGFGSDFDDLFERFFSDVGVPAREITTAAPRIDVKESENEVVVEADLPGVEEKDIEVSLHDGVLTLQAKRHEEAESKDEQTGWHRRERVYRSFHRAVPMPVAVDGEKVQASYKAGVLRVTLPKAAEARPRKIEVRAS